MASYTNKAIKGIFKKPVPNNLNDANKDHQMKDRRGVITKTGFIPREKYLPPAGYDAEPEFTSSSSDSTIDLNRLHTIGEGGMESEIRKKVLVDLFASPISLVPIVGGLTALMASWVFGSITAAFFALCTTIVGGAIFATRLIYGLESITKAAFEALQKQRETERNQILDALDESLRKDKDPRPEQCLRELRVLHNMLRTESDSTACGGDILETFEQMFDVCLKKIKKTDDLWRSSRNLHQTSKQKFLDEREEIVKELIETTEHLSGVVRKAKDISEIKTDTELSQMSKELEQNLTVARRTQERLSNLGRSDYDTKEFE